MADEEKYRIESPEEEEEIEKKGLFRPLPQTEQTKFTTGIERPQPIVKFLGISMFENRRDRILLILIPLLTAIINTSVYSFIIISIWENSATFLFFIPIIVTIPIGLVLPETGQALVGGFLSAVFFFIIFVLFLMSPAILVPTIGLGEFLLSSVMLTVGYVIFIIVASLLGTIIGTILREFF